MRASSLEFLRSFLRRNFAGKPVVTSRNVGCFLMVTLKLRGEVHIQQRTNVTLSKYLRQKSNKVRTYNCFSVTHLDVQGLV